ncbi:MAG: ribonuclease HII [Oscillibacter sp.]|nr:ribonuclease HII [Oscillibacter sp.]
MRRDMETKDWRARERELWAQGFRAVCGCDEAGAGPLAGPVYAAAVILPPECDIPGLDDSKKLSEKRREALCEVITRTALAWSVARTEAAEIDATDILSARMKAMQAAIDGLAIKPDMALVDGNRDRGRTAAILTPHILIVGGDAESAPIAAASILAKVSRDRYVVAELARRYPQYAFEKHKGYGTKLHYELLDKYGPCPEHRKSYLKKWEARRRGKPGA